MADIALQRKNMVESQVRPSDVTDRRIMAAMTDLARERFVPDVLQALAYMEEDLPLAASRSMLAPRTLARLIQLCEVESRDKVLIAGALTGYSAALLAHLAGPIVALECDAGLAKTAEATLRQLAVATVKIATGPLAQGYAADAPYDVILIEGAIELLPDSLTDQLAPGGRLVAVEIANGVGRAIVVRRGTSGGLARRVAFEASAGLLAGFERPKSFVF